MKRYFLIAGCLTVIFLASFLREDRFVVVQREETAAPLQAYSASSTILFLGDTMLGRHVEELMGQYGSDYPFKQTQNILASSDLVVTNLEGPVMSAHTRTPSKSVRFSFASTTPEILARNNIRLVSLANNHTFDFGAAGYAETQHLLKASGIQSVGHPYAAGSASIIHTSVGDFPIAVASFNISHPKADTAKMLDELKRARRTPDEFLVVLAHGGDEYIRHSNAYQERVYRSFIDTGADVVVAHHPHVVQEIELYKGKPIFYSLGNFIFDQYFSTDVERGLAVKLTLSKAKAEYRLVPLASSRSQPRIVSDAESKKFLEDIASRSAPSIQENIWQGGFDVDRVF